MRKLRIALVFNVILCLALLAVMLPEEVTLAGSSSLINPGFETGDFTGWNQGTVSDGVYVVGPDGFEIPPEGSYMARLGTAAEHIFDYQDPGPNEIYQEFTASTPDLSFLYNICTWDYEGWNHFEYELRTTDTDEVIDAYIQGAWGADAGFKSTGWQPVHIDISSYTGRPLRLTFNCGSTEDPILPTWAYIDLFSNIIPSQLTSQLGPGQVMWLPKYVVCPTLQSHDHYDVKLHMYLNAYYDEYFEGNFYVYTWDGSSWVIRDTIPYDPWEEWRWETTDLSGFLPDPDYEYKVRISNDMDEDYDPAAYVDKVYLEVDGDIYAPYYAREQDIIGILYSLLYEDAEEDDGDYYNVWYALNSWATVKFNLQETIDIWWSVVSDPGLTVNLTPDVQQDVTGDTITMFEETIVVDDDPLLIGQTLHATVSFIIGRWGDQGNNFGTEEIAIEVVSADLAVTKTDTPDPVDVGTDLTYSVTVTNNGPSNATDVLVIDELPTAVTFKSADSHGKGSYNSSTGIWSGFDLVDGESAVLDLVVTVNSSTPPGIIENLAGVTWAVYDPDENNNVIIEDTLVIVPNVHDPKTVILEMDADGDGVASPGDTLRYINVIMNDGDGTALNVKFSDVPDPNTTLVAGSVTSTQGYISKGNFDGDQRVEVALGDMPGHSQAMVTFAVTINKPLWEPRIANQALVTGNNFTGVKSDDPGTTPLNDPTVININTSPSLPGMTFWGGMALAFVLGIMMVWVLRRRQMRSGVH